MIGLRPLRHKPTDWAKTIGATAGFADVWGLSYWADKLYGSTNRGELLTIDQTTGKGAIVSTSPERSFWGAAVVLSP